jgi:4-amino-4-deoxy-L-arabinose transferase-like glycosyltransferase
MLEIPALAMALSAAGLMIIGGGTKWSWYEIFAGVAFGLGLQMKLVPAVYLPLIALVIYVRRKGPPHGGKHAVGSLVVLGMALACTYVAADLLIERGAYLVHFQQSWSSHFAPARSFEYGSAKEHKDNMGGQVRENPVHLTPNDY